ncbi:MAG: hypothetical protein H6738_03515 [Alphaproteobacteria bacterium]|nr:hypothetical protein [Alphaproteobacteria bacterium]MCB9695836.1 hypothetical protein [Alphaproteobacteria bacterium]
MILPLLASVSLAHAPHDPTYVLGVSPAVTTDGFVIMSRFPSQNWRAQDLVASSDGGVTFDYAFRGLENRRVLVDLSLSPHFDVDGVSFATSEDAGWLTTDSAHTWTVALPSTSLGRTEIVDDGAGGLVILADEPGGPLWRSTDLGATWDPIALSRPLVALTSFGPRVVAASSGALYVSDDAGATFITIPVPDTLYDVAVTDGVIAVGAESGLLIGDTGGLSLSPGIEGPVMTVAIAPDFAANQTILAARQIAGPYVSTDGGQTFVLSRANLVPSDQEPGRHFYSFQFSGGYTNDGIVYANTFEGLIVSRDFGSTWVELDTRPPALINAIALSPDYDTDRTLLLATSDGGMWVSQDAGETYAISNNDMKLSTIYDVAMVHDQSGAPEAVLAQNGYMTWGTPPYDGWELRSLPQGIDYTTRVALSPNWSSDGIGVVGTRYFGLFRTSDHGQTWSQVAVTGTAVSGLAFSTDGQTVLAGNNFGRLFFSADAGQTWVTLPENILGAPVWVTSDDDGFLIGTGIGLFTSPDGTTLTRLPDFDQPIHQVKATGDGTRYVVVRGGGLYRSDAGGPWTQIAPSLTELGLPYEIGVSPNFATDGTLFVGMDEHVLRSRDRGDTWTEVTPTRIRYEEDCQALRPSGALLGGRMTRAGASVTKASLIAADTSIDFEFSGTGIAWIAPNTPDLGEADVYVDGAVVGHVSLQGPEADQVEVFRWDGLPWGTHTLHIQPTGTDPIALDAIDLFRVPEPGTTTTTDGPTDTGLAPTTGETGDPGTTDGTHTTDGTTTDDDDDGKGCKCATGSTPGLAVLGWPALIALVAARRRSAVHRSRR